MSFEVGDKIKLKDYSPIGFLTYDGTYFDSTQMGKFRGETLEVYKVIEDFGPGRYKYYTIGNQYTWCEDWMELVDNKKNMNIREKFALSFKKEPEKSFQKAGITDGNDVLTNDGQIIFLSWLLKKNGEAFKTEVVDDLLKKDEE